MKILVFILFFYNIFSFAQEDGNRNKFCFVEESRTITNDWTLSLFLNPLEYPDSEINVYIELETGFSFNTTKTPYPSSASVTEKTLTWNIKDKGERNLYAWFILDNEIISVGNAYDYNFVAKLDVDRESKAEECPTISPYIITLVKQHVNSHGYIDNTTNLTFLVSVDDKEYHLKAGSKQLVGQLPFQGEHKVQEVGILDGDARRDLSGYTVDINILGHPAETFTIEQLRVFEIMVRNMEKQNTLTATSTLGATVSSTYTEDYRTPSNTITQLIYYNTPSETIINNKSVQSHSLSMKSESMLVKSESVLERASITKTHSMLVKSESVPERASITKTHSILVKSESVPERASITKTHSMLVKSESVPERASITKTHSMLVKSESISEKSNRPKTRVHHSPSVSFNQSKTNTKTITLVENFRSATPSLTLSIPVGKPEPISLTVSESIVTEADTIDRNEIFSDLMKADSIFSLASPELQALPVLLLSACNIDIQAKIYLRAVAPLQVSGNFDDYAGAVYGSVVLLFIVFLLNGIMMTVAFFLQSNEDKKRRLERLQAAAALVFFPSVGIYAWFYLLNGFIIASSLTRSIFASILGFCFALTLLVSLPALARWVAHRRLYAISYSIVCEGKARVLGSWAAEKCLPSGRFDHLLLRTSMFSAIVTPWRRRGDYWPLMRCATPLCLLPAALARGSACVPLFAISTILFVTAAGLTLFFNPHIIPINNWLSAIIFLLNACLITSYTAFLIDPNSEVPLQATLAFGVLQLILIIVSIIINVLSLFIFYILQHPSAGDSMPVRYLCFICNFFRHPETYCQLVKGSLMWERVPLGKEIYASLFGAELEMLADRNCEIDELFGDLNRPLSINRFSESNETDTIDPLDEREKFSDIF